MVVGFADNGADEYAFRYENGTVTRLRTPAGYPHVFPAPAINAAGDVIANAEPDGADGATKSIALIWRAGTDTAVKLPLPIHANVVGITDDGALIGTMYANGDATGAYAWDQGGHGRQLDAPVGDIAAGYAARGDWATGGLWASGGGNGEGVRWDLRTGAATAIPAGGVGGSINASGWITDGPVVVGMSGVMPLASLGTDQKNEPNSVADNGLVVGTSGGPATRQPVTWRC